MAEQYRRQAPIERLRAAASMFESARAIVESSLPATLSVRDRRLQLAKRMYEGQLPDLAVAAYADFAERMTDRPEPVDID